MGVRVHGCACAWVCVCVGVRGCACAWVCVCVGVRVRVSGINTTIDLKIIKMIV